MEKNSTIIFPLPLDLIAPLMQIMQHQAEVSRANGQEVSSEAEALRRWLALSEPD